MKFGALIAAGREDAGLRAGRAGAPRSEPRARGRRRRRRSAADGDAAAAPSTFASLADVDAALAAALGYFQAKEPSSPALLLIAQARATLGKNLYEVMRLLAPRHAENARVFVGPGDAFSIPVSSLQDAPALDFSPGERRRRNRAPPRSR